MTEPPAALAGGPVDAAAQTRMCSMAVDATEVAPEVAGRSTAATRSLDRGQRRRPLPA
jgi:hypothetical protein